MKIVPSRFNVIIPSAPDGREFFLYNTFSDSEARITPELKGLLENGHGALGPNEALLSAYADELVDLGFMVGSLKEENTSIQEWFAGKRRNQEELRVTILPTYGCNLRCMYCFQSDLNQPSSKISPQIILRIVEWVGERMDSIRPEKLTLTFFGGEPLLHRKEIIAMSSLITDEACRRGVYTVINLITNGTLLDADFVNAMVPLGLKGAKITLDGMPEFHDRFRCDAKGKGTFEVILNNLFKNKDKMKFTIGSNYNHENVGSLPEMYDYLLEYGLGNVISQVNFKPIFQDGKKSFCDTCTYSEIDPAVHLGLIEEVEKRDLKTQDWVALGPCDFHRRNSFTIDPQGKIYKCEGFAGMEEAVIGDLDTKDIEEKSEECIRQFDVFGKCGDCTYLPICGGGCRYWGYQKTGDLNGVACEKGYFETVAKELIRRRGEDKRGED